MSNLPVVIFIKDTAGNYHPIIFKNNDKLYDAINGIVENMSEGASLVYIANVTLDQLIQDKKEHLIFKVDSKDTKKLLSQFKTKCKNIAIEFDAEEGEENTQGYLNHIVIESNTVGIEYFDIGSPTCHYIICDFGCFSTLFRINMSVNKEEVTFDVTFNGENNPGIKEGFNCGFISMKLFADFTQEA